MPATAPKAVDTILSTETPQTKVRDIDQEFIVAQENLSIFREPHDEVLLAGYMRALQDDPHYILRDGVHSRAIQDLLAQSKKAGGERAMRVVNSFYANNGKIWVSNKTTVGQNSTHAGNMFI
jgi:hypothetical protein